MVTRRAAAAVVMASSQKVRSLSVKSWEINNSELGEGGPATMFDVFHRTGREIMLQRLILIAQLPRNLADRTELGAHYEKLNFQLSKQYSWDHVTGLLLIYPSCLLHVIEASRDILLPVLKDVKDMQQTENPLLETAKVVFVAHDPQNRMFHQWSYKVLRADQVTRDGGTKGLEEEEESTETLVCGVLSVLQSLGERLEGSRDFPGLVLDETPELIVPQDVLEKLLTRDELQTPKLFLQMYNSPLNISMDFGQVTRSSCLTKV